MELVCCALSIVKKNVNSRLDIRCAVCLCWGENTAYIRYAVHIIVFKVCGSVHLQSLK